METIQNSTETSEKLGLQIRNILEDGKLSQEMDEIEISKLTELLASEETQAYSATKELLKESLVSSLKKGISVQGQAQKDFLQKVITLAGLNFDINAIYETNRDFLSKKAEFGYRYESYDTGGYSSEPTAYEISPSLSPEEQNYIFKYDSRQNGALIVYEYDDFLIDEGTMLGYIPTGDSVIQQETGNDDTLDDNNTMRISNEDLENGLREDALREQAQTAQKLAEEEALRAQEAEAALKAQKKDFETQVEGLEDEISTLNTQLTDLTEKNGDQAGTINTLKEKITLLDGEIASLRMALQNANPKQTQTLLPDMEEIKKDLTACKGEISKLQTQKPALSFGKIEGKNSSELPYSLGQEIGEITSEKTVKEEETTSEEAQEQTSTEKKEEIFNFSNPLKFWEVGNEHLSKIPMNSKADLITLLQKYKEKSFPKDHFAASEYAFAFQCAISLLDPNNSLGNIDGYWGKNSSKALQKVQQEILGFSGKDADGKPGPRTLSRLLEEISQK